MPLVRYIPKSSSEPANATSAQATQGPTDETTLRAHSSGASPESGRDAQQEPATSRNLTAERQKTVQQSFTYDHSTDHIETAQRSWQATTAFEASPRPTNNLKTKASSASCVEPLTKPQVSVGSKHRDEIAEARAELERLREEDRKRNEKEDRAKEALYSRPRTTKQVLLDEEEDDDGEEAQQSPQGGLSEEELAALPEPPRKGKKPTRKSQTMPPLTQRDDLSSSFARMGINGANSSFQSPPTLPQQWGRPPFGPQPSYTPRPEQPPFSQTSSRPVHPAHPPFVQQPQYPPQPSYAPFMPSAQHPSYFGAPLQTPPSFYNHGYPGNPPYAPPGFVSNYDSGNVTYSTISDIGNDRSVNYGTSRRRKKSKNTTVDGIQSRVDDRINSILEDSLRR